MCLVALEMTRCVLTLYLCLSLRDVCWSVWNPVIWWRRKPIVRTVRLEIRHGAWVSIPLFLEDVLNTVCPSCPLFSFYMLRYSISNSCYWFSKSELWVFVFCDFSGGALFFCCLLQTPTAWETVTERILLRLVFTRKNPCYACSPFSFNSCRNRHTL